MGIKSSFRTDRAGTMFVGTYTFDSDSRGIYAVRFDAATGTLQEPRCVAQTHNPSFVVIDRKSRTLYAVEETLGDSGKNGAIHAYRIVSDEGQLQWINSVDSLGVGPCFLAIDHHRGTLFTVNYHSGSITAVSLQPDGSLGQHASHIQLTGRSTHPTRQLSPHPHAIVITPDNRHAIVADLGTDRLLLYAIDESTGGLQQLSSRWIDFPPQSGPRHLVIHPHRPFLYVIHEISSRVSVHRLGGKAVVSAPLQWRACTDQPEGAILDGADIAIAPSGRFLYTSIRQTNTVHGFSVDADSGLLTPVSDTPSGGISPLAMGLPTDSPSLIVANQQSGTLTSFNRLPSGELRQQDQLSLPSPSSVTFLTEPRR